jgi:hypothetical protein
MTGYLEIEICTQEFPQGKKFPVKFGNYALLEYGKMKNLSMEEIDPSKDYFQFAVDIVYCGLKNVAYLKQEACPATLAEVREAMDNISMTELESIISVYLGSIKNSKFIQESMKLAAGGGKGSKKK